MYCHYEQLHDCNINLPPYDITPKMCIEFKKKIRKFVFNIVTRMDG